MHPYSWPRRSAEGISVCPGQCTRGPALSATDLHAAAQHPGQHVDACASALVLLGHACRKLQTSALLVKDY